MTIGAIPLTEATDNKAEIQNQLNRFNIAYPGNLFAIQEVEDGRKVLVAWIPANMLGAYLISKVQSSLPFSVPMNWPNPS